MKKVTFNDESLSLSFSMVHETSTIEEPTPKTYLIDIPFGNGSIDLTESMTGSVVFNDRTLSMSFGIKKTLDTDAEYDSFKRKYLGKMVRINTDDSEHHYKGRLTTLEKDEQIGFIRVVCTIQAEAYRYKNEVTIVEVSSTAAEQIINLENEQMPAVVTMETTDSVVIKHGTNSFAFNAGTHTLPFVLAEGTNEVRISGEADVTFLYQEGVL